MLILLAASVAFMVYRWVFPGDDRLIRQLFARLASQISVAPNASPLSRLASGNELVRHFTDDVSVSLDNTGAGPAQIDGRDSLREMVIAGRSQLHRLEVEFPDVVIRLAPDHQTAVAHVTALVHINGERNSNAQELQFQLRRTEGRWLIARVESIRVLRP